MPTFAEFVEAKPMKDQQLADIERYAVMLCDALYMDIKYQTLRHHGNAIDIIEERIARYSAKKGTEKMIEDQKVERAYHIRKIHEIDTQGVDHEFYTETARKYIKVWYRSGTSRSIHAFIDKKTGDVYKPASLKAPAKGVRFNVLDDDSREEMLKRADWAGGYLYVR